MSTIADRIAALRAEVDDVARAAGRDPATIRICAVTKRRPREDVLAARAAGLVDVGENYLQEAREKYVDLPEGTVRHFLGHLQTNKAKAIVESFDVVQSVDRPEAARALARAVERAGRAVRCLVQVNVSPTERFGVAPEDAESLVKEMRREGLIVDGIMAIAPNTGDDGAILRAFRAARETFDRVGGSTLSLGMSGDWRHAITTGSTMLRIGTAIFGARA